MSILVCTYEGHGGRFKRAFASVRNVVLLRFSVTKNLNPLDPADADADGDGFTNLENALRGCEREYLIHRKDQIINIIRR